MLVLILLTLFFVLFSVFGDALQQAHSDSGILDIYPGNGERSDTVEVGLILEVRLSSGIFLLLIPNGGQPVGDFLRVLRFAPPPSGTFKINSIPDYGIAELAHRTTWL